MKADRTLRMVLLQIIISVMSWAGPWCRVWILTQGHLTLTHLTGTSVFHPLPPKLSCKASPSWSSAQSKQVCCTIPYKAFCNATPYLMSHGLYWNLLVSPLTSRQRTEVPRVLTGVWGAGVGAGDALQTSVSFQLYPALAWQGEQNQVYINVEQLSSWTCQTSLYSVIT